MDAPGLSFVVLTRDRCDEVLECLESLIRQDVSGSEIVLVDNGSRDGTTEAVRRRFPTVAVVEAGLNLGVAGGRNRGAARARGAVCLFIDDDARLVDPSAARHLLARFAEAPQTAVLALRIRDAASGADARPAIPRRDKRLPEDGEECAYFCGAGFAVRRDVFLALGGFWEALRYAGEELDFSFRLLAAGHRIQYVRAVEVLHREVETARPAGQWVYSQARSRALVAARDLPLGPALTTVVVWWTYTAAVAVRRGQVAAWLRGVRDAVRGLGHAWRLRRPIDRRTFARVRRLGGRSTW